MLRQGFGKLIQKIRFVATYLLHLLFGLMNQYECPNGTIPSGKGKQIKRLVCLYGDPKSKKKMIGS